MPLKGTSLALITISSTLICEQAEYRESRYAQYRDIESPEGVLLSCATGRSRLGGLVWHDQLAWSEQGEAVTQWQSFILIVERYTAQRKLFTSWDGAVSVVCPQRRKLERFQDKGLVSAAWPRPGDDDSSGSGRGAGRWEITCPVAARTPGPARFVYIYI